VARNSTTVSGDYRFNDGEPDTRVTALLQARLIGAIEALKE